MRAGLTEPVPRGGEACYRLWVQPLEVLFHDDTFVLGVSGRLMVTAYWDAPHVSQILKITELAIPWNQEHERRTAFMQFIIEGTPRFSSEVRDAAAEISRSRLFRLGTASVVEVGGLRGAATRAFLSTVTLLGRGTKRVQVFADPREASTWMHGKLDAHEPDTWTVERLLSLRAAALEGRTKR